MDIQMKPCNDNTDFLSQSYNDGVERIVGFKNNAEFTVSKKVLKKRQQFWDDLCTTYSRPFSSDIEYNIATLQRCKSLNFVQYWINTSYLPYQALAEEAKNPESDMVLMEDASSNSSFLCIGKENLSEYHTRLSYDGSSLSSSIDTTAYILSNTNKTNKVKTMVIVEGAKHNVSPNQRNCGNVETVQFRKTMFDNNGNAYQAALPTTPSKSTESLTQQMRSNAPTDPVNRDNTSNCNLEHDEELFNAEDNATKLSRRKKLYSGRDSPVDLVNTTSSNKIVPINSTMNLHPALHPAWKRSNRFELHRKRKRSDFSVFHTSKLNRSIVSISSYRKHKRRRIARRHVNESSSIMESSKKPTKGKSFMESPSSKELISTESKLDNSAAQVEKFVNRFPAKSDHASSTHLNPRIYLRPITERDIQKYGSSKKSTMSPRGLCPVVRLIRLSDSDIEKYRKPNREATRPDSLSPIMQLKQLTDSDIEKYRKPNREATRPRSSSPITQLKQTSEFNNPERRKSQDALDVRFRPAVVRLRKLSEQDIKKYQTEFVRSEDRDTANVSHNSSKCSNISQPCSKIIQLIGDSDSEKSTFLICKRNSSVSLESRQSSSSIVGASKNRNLVREDKSNKCTGPNNSALYKTSETPQRRFRRNIVIASSSNSSGSVERRSPRKNSKTIVSSLKTSKSGLPEEGVRQNDEAISCSDESERFNRNSSSNGASASKHERVKHRSHSFILSDEDDGFVNLVRYSKQRTNSKSRSPYNSPRKNSKIRSPYNSPENNSESRSPYNSPEKNSKSKSPYNSPEKNSDDPVETRNVGKGTRKSKEAQLLSESNGQNTKFEKQASYLYRKRRSKNLLYISKAENINRAAPVSITRSCLSGAYGCNSNQSQVLSRDKRQLLTNMNINRNKNHLHTLRFQTKIFDSDSESSFFS